MIQVCVDKDVISRVFNHPKVYPFITDDLSPQFYEPVLHPQIQYLVDESQEGVIRVDPLNGIACTVHIATTPKMWGRAHDFVKEAIQWGFANTTYQKVVAMVPAFNDHTLKLVRDVGFAQEGVLKKSFLKSWKHHDQIVFGLFKGDTQWQQ